MSVPGSIFNYVVPTNGQALVETINNGSNNTGTVSIITGTGTTRLAGGTPQAGMGNTWTDSSGDQYQFLPANIDSNLGTLTITQGLVGSGGLPTITSSSESGAAPDSPPMNWA